MRATLIRPPQINDRASAVGPFPFPVDALERIPCARPRRLRAVRHITFVRPPVISSRVAYTVGVVLPIGPAYVAPARNRAVSALPT